MIESERFLLREIDPNVDDLTPYLGWIRNGMSNPYIEGINPHYTEEDLRKYVVEKNDKDDALLLGIFTKTASKHIGNIKFEPMSAVLGQAWLGILIGDEAWRNVHAAREVITEAIEWLRRSMGITVYLLGVSRKNVAAIRSYKAVGFFEIEQQIEGLQEDAVVMKLDLAGSRSATFGVGPKSN